MLFARTYSATALPPYPPCPFCILKTKGSLKNIPCETPCLYPSSPSRNRDLTSVTSIPFLPLSGAARIAACGLVVLAVSLVSVARGAVVAESKLGVVVAGAAEAAAAGAEVLRQGGTAADAAVAVSLSLTIAEPFNSGIGGKLAGLYYDAASGKTWFIDGLGRAPAH